MMNILLRSCSKPSRVMLRYVWEFCCEVGCVASCMANAPSCCNPSLRTSVLSDGDRERRCSADGSGSDISRLFSISSGFCECSFELPVPLDVLLQTLPIPPGLKHAVKACGFGTLVEGLAVDAKVAGVTNIGAPVWSNGVGDEVVGDHHVSGAACDPSGWFRELQTVLILFAEIIRSKGGVKAHSCKVAGEDVVAPRVHHQLSRQRFWNVTQQHADQRAEVPDLTRQLEAIDMPVAHPVTRSGVVLAAKVTRKPKCNLAAPDLVHLLGGAQELADNEMQRALVVEVGDGETNGLSLWGARGHHGYGVLPTLRQGVVPEVFIDPPPSIHHEIQRYNISKNNVPILQQLVLDLVRQHRAQVHSRGACLPGGCPRTSSHPKRIR
mmetsp:Transcript_6069/g.17716  ORF Transcript_6069/g.17716 Transcript_6069/m.17716 type:complete len:381 (-) Transcript_6069:304-1446(-)